MLNPDYRDMLSAFADAGGEYLGVVGKPRSLSPVVPPTMYVRCIPRTGVIRRQLYITEAREEALKDRARSLGILEAELIRRALDVFLNDPSCEEPRHRPALERLLEHTRAPADQHRLPADYEFDRDELCVDRASWA